ncbi:MAG: DUF932 domain-containing protein [Pseudomonadota bacterium]
MPHEINSFAYTGDAPWHSLGNRLPAKQPLEVWAAAAGMNWEIRETPVRFQPAGSPESSVLAFEDQKVLYRSDNNKALSVVSRRYRTVQPEQILAFYKGLTEASGFELETAGVLKEGRKLFALAKTGKQTVLKGGDRVDGYILLATSCDGTLATTATHTTVRVVCANTLAAAIDGAKGAVKVPHNTIFDPDLVKSQLGIAVSQWDAFMYRMKELTHRKVKDSEIETFLRKVLSLPEGAVSPTERVTHARSLKKLHALYLGEGRGADLASAKGTAFGLLQACTQWVDHERRARNQDYRRDSAWFGQGASLKERALSEALELLA